MRSHPHGSARSTRGRVCSSQVDPACLTGYFVEREPFRRSSTSLERAAMVVLDARSRSRSRDRERSALSMSSALKISASPRSRQDATISRRCGQAPWPACGTDVRSLANGREYVAAARFRSPCVPSPTVQHRPGFIPRQSTRTLQYGPRLGRLPILLVGQRDEPLAARQHVRRSSPVAQSDILPSADLRDADAVDSP